MLKNSGQLLVKVHRSEVATEVRLIPITDVDLFAGRPSATRFRCFVELFNT